MWSKRRSAEVQVASRFPFWKETATGTADPTVGTEHVGAQQTPFTVGIIPTGTGIVEQIPPGFRSGGG